MNADYLNQALSASPQARDAACELVNRYMRRNNGWLNPREVRALAEYDMLDEPNEPRPAPRLTSNMSTATLHTFHRARLPQPCRKHPGTWMPRLKTIPIDARKADVLLRKFRGKLSDPTRECLERVVSGQTSRKKRTKNTQEAVYA